MKCVIMRLPVLMEDEGRSHLVKITETYEEAKEWVAAQEGEYFGPGDYQIYKEFEDVRS